MGKLETKKLLIEKARKICGSCVRPCVPCLLLAGRIMLKEDCEELQKPA